MICGRGAAAAGRLSAMMRVGARLRRRAILILEERTEAALSCAATKWLPLRAVRLKCAIRAAGRYSSLRISPSVSCAFHGIPNDVIERVVDCSLVSPS